jgi:hypothetical protein
MKKVVLKLFALGLLLGGIASAAPELMIVAEETKTGAARLTSDLPGDPTPRVVICKGDGC